MGEPVERVHETEVEVLLDEREDIAASLAGVTVEDLLRRVDPERRMLVVVPWAPRQHFLSLPPQGVIQHGWDHLLDPIRLTYSLDFMHRRLPRFEVLRAAAAA